MKKRIPFKTIKVHLSSLSICPYSYRKRWIIVFAEAKVERQIQILIRELNHFMFYFYFGRLEDELGKEKFESLKGVLTVLTNPEEKGYPDQKGLRLWLTKQKKTIPKIIESGCWKDYSQQNRQTLIGLCEFLILLHQSVEQKSLYTPLCFYSRYSK